MFISNLPTEGVKHGIHSPMVGKPVSDLTGNSLNRGGDLEDQGLLTAAVLYWRLGGEDGMIWATDSLAISVSEAVVWYSDGCASPVVSRNFDAAKESIGSASAMLLFLSTGPVWRRNHTHI